MGWRELIVSDVKAVWKQASTWVLVALAPFPDIYNVVAGWVGYTDLPPAAKHAMYGFAAVGLLAKHYRQKSKDSP